MNPEQRGDFLHARITLVGEMRSMRKLRRRKRGLAAELRSASYGRCSAGARALNDQTPLELGHAAEDGQYHTAGRRCRVCPWLGQTPQAPADLHEWREGVLAASVKRSSQ